MAIYSDMGTIEKADFTADALAGEEYISLTTFRRNGNQVPTPIWFVEIDGKIYGKTQADAGKVKRIRNNEHVTFAACNARGGVHGETFIGKATLHAQDTATAERIDNAMNKKYGLIKRGFDLMMWMRQAEYAFIEITPQTSDV